MKTSEVALNDSVLRIFLIGFVVLFFFFVFSSCDIFNDLHNTDNIEVEGNNITLLIDRPIVGIVGIGKWHWPNLEDALNDLYSQFKYLSPYVHKCPTYNINVRFRSKVHDKYGNESYNYEETYLLVTVPGDEIEKYKNVDYMNNGLGLSSKIRDVLDKTTEEISLDLDCENKYPDTVSILDYFSEPFVKPCDPDDTLGVYDLDDLYLYD